MIVIIDNYDSFTYNLVHYLGEIGVARDDMFVVRNDVMSAVELAALKPSHVIISPGPCTPKEAGVSIELVQRLCGEVPILGVCLGHQAIAAAFGGEIIRAPEAVHGKTTRIAHCETGLFAGIEQNFTATRYHSLIVNENNLPDCLNVTGRNAEGLIMALEHKRFSTTVGVQFHPESIMTEVGRALLRNFLALSAAAGRGWVSAVGR
ncbi:MAG: aminodeoxychorismate/anthranilate synthase component II [Bdellovibrionales bacterium]|nr:aminodeoxychorismate/anthranilate synthase component II [Bdellovibrionales bacterium]